MPKNQALSTQILLVDDDTEFTKCLELSFLKDDITCIIANDGQDGLEKLKNNSPKVIVADYRMPVLNGVEFLKEAKKRHPEIPFIFITASDESTELRLKVLEAGAYRYIRKPFTIEECRLVILDAIEKCKSQSENVVLKHILGLEHSNLQIISNDPKFKKLFYLADQVCKTNVSILITGETGTGKDLMARYIHEKSDRADFPFISFNCAALSESLIESELFGHEKGAFTGADRMKLGRFELANNGTIFLDEIAELNPAMQVKLLRVIQEKAFERVGGVETIKVNVRITCASNKNISSMVAKNKFREDLFYRLNTFPIHLPPLRDRGNDIEILANYFLNKYAKEYRKNITQFTKDSMTKLKDYSWKGNIREMQNVISRAVILSESDIIQPSELFLYKEKGKKQQIIEHLADLNLTEEDLTKQYAKAMLIKCNNNKNKTAKLLHLNIKTFNSRLT